MNDLPKENSSQTVTPKPQTSVASEKRFSKVKVTRVLCREVSSWGGFTQRVTIRSLSYSIAILAFYCATMLQQRVNMSSKSAEWHKFACIFQNNIICT
jgi:hypothetical protein